MYIDTTLDFSPGRMAITPVAAGLTLAALALLGDTQPAFAQGSDADDAMD